MTASGDWRADLRVARLARDPTLEQLVWDGHWQRWLAIALRSGRRFKEAIAVAWTRTEAQYGQRPTSKETQP